MLCLGSLWVVSVKPLALQKHHTRPWGAACTPLVLSPACSDPAKGMSPLHQHSEKQGDIPANAMLGLWKDNRGPGCAGAFFAWCGCPFACAHRGGRARPCRAKAAAASLSAGFSICVTSSRFWPCVDKLPYLQSIIPLDSVIAFPGSHVSHAS